jgi:hypothetical protein
MVLAMFKNRNMELVEEVGRLRKELESAKQQLLILQNTSHNPGIIMHVLDEMTRLSVGQPADSVFMAALTGGGSSEAGGHTSINPEGAAHRGAEFAAEIARMPPLPGAPIVQTVKEMPSPVPPPVSAAISNPHSSFPPINITDMVMPCVFSQ